MRRSSLIALCTFLVLVATPALTMASASAVNSTRDLSSWQDFVPV